MHKVIDGHTWPVSVATPIVRAPLKDRDVIDGKRLDLDIEFIHIHTYILKINVWRASLHLASSPANSAAKPTSSDPTRV